MNERPTAKELADSSKPLKKWINDRPGLVQVNGKWYRINKTTRRTR